MVINDPSDTKNLASLIKWHRKQCNLNQYELAEMAEVGRTSVQRVENGEGFEFITLLKIMHVLNLKLKIEGPLIPTYEGMTES